MLYIFGGLPGAGKTTLARYLARELKAVHLRIDSIEQALRHAGGPPNGPVGYIVAYRVAVDNLRLGLSVVADSVNPLQITRAAWRDAANQAGASHVEIEVICSDPAEHRARVESRAADISGLRLPTWDDVRAHIYEPWQSPHLVIDTAGQTPPQSLAALKQALGALPDHAATKPLLGPA